jgi:hypothetical protein
VFFGGLLMTSLSLCLTTANSAEAASRSIRLRAYVPVSCALKRVAPYGIVQRGHGPGTGKFKIVCNAPYRMHMQGTRVPAHWPHIPFFPNKHAGSGLDVALRVVGNDGALDANCALAPDGGCRGLNSDEGASPPRLGQAEVRVDRRGHAATAASDASGQTQTSDADGAPDRKRQPWHWQRRMGLGALARVASAGESSYVPRYVVDAMRDGTARGDAPGADIFDRADRDIGGRADEHITVYLTLTGRY